MEEFKKENVYQLTHTELYDLLLRVWKDGYNTYEMVEVGAESYDPDTIVRWIILGLKNKIV